MALYRKRTKSSASEDEEIIRMYWRRDENAIRETDLKYGGYLFAVAYRIVRDRRDCEECLNDTYVGVWEAVPPAWPNALKAFLTTIMRRVAINRYHAGLRKKRIPSEMTVVLSELEDVLAGDGDVGEEADAERLGRVISDYIRTLSERRNFIFMSRYYAAEPLDEIARALMVSRSTVNKELAYIKKGLKERLIEEGYSV